MSLIIVRHGHWLYADSVEMQVDGVGLDYDWWYESASGAGILERDRQPMESGIHGLIYYARFKRAGENSEPTWLDSDGCTTPEDAMIAAEAKTPTPITWN